MHKNPGCENQKHCLNIERGFFSSGGRGRGVKEKDKHGTTAVNIHVTKVSCSHEAATIGKSSMVYVNEAGQVNMNVAEFGNGNEKVHVDATCNPNVE
nr:hypothetical protein [Tanacetum cinerariifolium]